MADSIELKKDCGCVGSKLLSLTLHSADSLPSEENDHLNIK